MGESEDVIVGTHKRLVAEEAATNRGQLVVGLPGADSHQGLRLK